MLQLKESITTQGVYYKSRSITIQGVFYNSRSLLQPKESITIQGVCYNSRSLLQFKESITTDDIIYLFRMAQLNTVHIKIYTRFLFSEVLIHTIIQSCNIRKYKIKTQKKKLKESIKTQGVFKDSRSLLQFKESITTQGVCYSLNKEFITTQGVYYNSRSLLQLKESVTTHGVCYNSRN